MAKKLLVKTPQTRDGVTLQYDDNKQVVYKESIVELAAKKNLESINARLPKQLRHEISETDTSDSLTGDSNEALKERLKVLEAESENVELKRRIAELEGTLATTGAGVTTEKDRGLDNTADVLAKIAKAKKVEIISELLKDEKRSEIIEAGNRKIAELTPNQ